MTFRQSLYFSVSVHFLIFGCAVAVAQYGGALFGPHRDVMFVSLITSGRPASLETGAARSSERSSLPDDHADEPPSVKPSGGHFGTGDEQGVPQQADHGSVGADAGQLETGSSTGQAAEERQGSVPSEVQARIEAAIERTKNYPRLARERGMEGVVRLRFRLSASGDVEAVEVVKSSGYEILDSASIRAVYRAAPMPSVNGWIEMPIKYVLK